MGAGPLTATWHHDAPLGRVRVVFGGIIPLKILKVTYSPRFAELIERKMEPDQVAYNALIPSFGPEQWVGKPKGDGSILA